MRLINQLKWYCYLIDMKFIQHRSMCGKTGCLKGLSGRLSIYSALPLALSIVSMTAFPPRKNTRSTATSISSLGSCLRSIFLWCFYVCERIRTHFFRFTHKKNSIAGSSLWTLRIETICTFDGRKFLLFWCSFGRKWLNSTGSHMPKAWRTQNSFPSAVLCRCCSDLNKQEQLQMEF